MPNAKDIINISIDKQYAKDNLRALQDAVHDPQERPRAVALLGASALGSAALGYAASQVPAGHRVPMHPIRHTLGAAPAYGLLGGSLYAALNKDDERKVSKGIGVATGSLAAVAASLAQKPPSVSAGAKLKDLAFITSALTAPALAVYAGQLAHERAVDYEKKLIMNDASLSPAEQAARVSAINTASDFDSKYPYLRYFNVPPVVRKAHDMGVVDLIKERLNGVL